MKRKWIAEKKLAIVLEGLREKRSVAKTAEGIRALRPYLPGGMSGLWREAGRG